MTFFIKKNEVYAFSWRTFLNPYPKSIWILILVQSVLVGSIIYFILTNSRILKFDNAFCGKFLKITWDLFKSSIFALSASVGTAPYKMKPSRESGRILIFTICLVGNTLFLAYQVRPKICCSFENLAINYFTFTAFHSADKFSNEQQIFGLTWSLLRFFELAVVWKSCKNLSWIKITWRQPFCSLDSR